MTPACPACQQPALLYFHATDRNRRVSDVVFDYWRCSACGLVFLDPMPDDLGAYYPARYYPIPVSVEGLAKQIRLQQGRINFVRRFIQQGKLLDIGASYGVFAHIAKENGYDVDTIEMDEKCCDFLEKQVGVRAFRSGDPVEALQQLGAYDVITLWQVIEHLPHPWQVIDACIEHLTEGGILVIATPNLESFQFCLFKSAWAHVDAPRHVELIPVTVLNKKMLAAGLTPVLISSQYEENTKGYNLSGWGSSFAGFFANYVLHRIVFRLGRTAGILLSSIDQSDFQGSTYTAVYQKPS